MKMMLIVSFWEPSTPNIIEPINKVVNQLVALISILNDKLCNIYSVEESNWVKSTFCVMAENRKANCGRVTFSP